MPKKVIKTRDQVKQDFRRRGVAVSQWAKDKGFSVQAVYAVLNGLNKGNYGKAHEIAVELGLKEDFS